MNKNELKLEARLIAMEYMIGHLHKVLHRAIGATPEMIEKMEKNFRDHLRTETIPGADAALGDLAIGEIEEAFDRLLSTIKEIREWESKKSGR